MARLAQGRRSPRDREAPERRAGTSSARFAAVEDEAIRDRARGQLRKVKQDAARRSSTIAERTIRSSGGPLRGSSSTKRNGDQRPHLEQDHLQQRASSGSPRRRERTLPRSGGRAATARPPCGLAIEVGAARAARGTRPKTAPPASAPHGGCDRRETRLQPPAGGPGPPPAGRAPAAAPPPPAGQQKEAAAPAGPASSGPGAGRAPSDQAGSAAGRSTRETTAKPRGKGRRSICSQEGLAGLAVQRRRRRRRDADERAAGRWGRTPSSRHSGASQARPAIARGQQPAPRAEAAEEAGHGPPAATPDRGPARGRRRRRGCSSAAAAS